MAATVILYALSPDGRLVVLTDRVWAHVVMRHENMAPHLADVLKTIQLPVYREPDARPGRERLYGVGVGPEKWLRVVIEFGAAFDRVITAFGQLSDPRLDP